ncbi:hypothetical protein JTB14_010303 [Gonioctena quinquepunctata]|nr:hypothetical protein JTB14_010303 [Gonioctena quinquepunctata]
MGTSESKPAKPKTKLKTKLGAKKKGKFDDAFTSVVPDGEEQRGLDHNLSEAPEYGRKVLDYIPNEKETLITDSCCEVTPKIEENDKKITATTPSSSESHFTDAQTPLGFQNQSEESIDLDVEVRNSSTLGAFLHDLTLNSFKLNEYSERHKKLSKLGVSKISQISLDSNPDGCFASDNVEIVSEIQYESGFGEGSTADDESLKNATKEVENEDTKVAQMVKRMSDVNLSNGVQYRRHMSVPLDMTIAGQENEVSKKVATLSLSRTELEAKITRPKFVPEKLDFQLYEKFEGQMLMNWYISEFNDSNNFSDFLNAQDLKILIIRFCTHLLAAGVLKQIPDKDVPMYNIFKPDCMYYWSHAEPPLSVPQTPGRLSMLSWPPASPQEVFLPPCGRDIFATSPDTEEKELKNSARDVEILSLEEEIKRLSQEVDKYKTLSEIQTLTTNAVIDFRSPEKEEKPFLPCDNSSSVSCDTKISEKKTVNSGAQTDEINLKIEVTTQTKDVFEQGNQTENETTSKLGGEAKSVCSQTEDISTATDQPMQGISPPPPAPPMPAIVPPPPPPMPGRMTALHLPSNAREERPPPPPPFGGPAPFPPSPAENLSIQKAAIRKPPVNPAVPMKPLYWTRIIATTVDMADGPQSDNNALWKQIDELPLSELSEFTELFSRQVVNRKPTVKKIEEKAKVEAVKLLDGKRSQNVGILAHSLKADIQEIENAIYNFDTSIVSLEALQQIYEVRATDEELEMIKSHLSSKPDVPLDKPEQFLCELSKISHFAGRISCLMFQVEFEDSIINSTKLKEVMAIILTLGNYMNGGNMTRGQADGFGLEILSKLRDVKSKDSKITLLHYVVRLYMKNIENIFDPNIALPVPEPGDIRRAASVNFDDVRADLLKLEKQLKACTNKSQKIIEASTPDNLQPFKDKMTTFLENSEKQLASEFESLKECHEQFISTMKFYLFKPKSGALEAFPPNSFFELWLQFAIDFKDIFKKELIRLEKEKVQEIRRRENERKSEEKRIKERENGLKAKYMEQFEFIVTLVNIVSKAMQSESLDIPNASQLLKNCSEFVKQYWAYSCASITAKEITYQAEIDPIFKATRTRRNKRLFDYKAVGLDLVATGVVIRPEGSDNNDNVKAWLKKDIEAQTLIGLNVSSNIAKKIAYCNSSFLMLDKLDMLYVININKSAVENCMIIQQYAEDLAAEGEEVKESWVMTRILGMLPSKLHHFRTAWDNVSPIDKNLNTIIERLRLEEDRLNGTEQQELQNAFMHKQSGRNEGNPQSNVECFKCGKKGHIKKHCRNKPCPKYLEYCKNGNDQNNGSQRSYQRNSNRRAFISNGLSTANVKVILSENDCSDCWYQDCGASQHMTSRKDWLTNFVELKEHMNVLIGDATKLEGIGIGEVELTAFNGKEWYEVLLKNVLYVPKMSFNLFSVSQMLDKGYIREADASQSTFKSREDNKIVAIAKRDENLFKMMFRQEEDEKCLVTMSIKTWHERFAHQNVQYVKDTLKRNGVKYVDDWNDYVCPGCVYGKQHHISHPLNTKVAQRPLDLVHVDLCEMNIISLGGAKYFLLFKDDFSHFRTVYFLKSKDEAVSKLNIRAKTEKKSKKGIFIGYDIDSPSYRIYIEEENDVVSSENVIFDEKLGPEKGYTELELNSEENQNSGGEETYEDETNESNHLKNKKENLDRFANDNSRKLRDRRDIRKPPNLDDYVLEYSTDDEYKSNGLI